MAPSKTQITASETSIPTCASSPQLMPFHIAYSGPAPIATFFRARQLEEEHRDSSVSSGTGLGDHEVPNQNDSSSSLKTKVGKRLVAAFRGRRVVGTEVPLPEGYVGLVLRSDASGTSRGPTGCFSTGIRENGWMDGNLKSRRKVSTRGSRRTKPIEIDDDDNAETNERCPDEMHLDSVADPDLTLNTDSYEGDVKTLKATRTFQSLVVWNADVAADEGRDEYIRALREWTDIAAEVHHTEE